MKKRLQTRTTLRKWVARVLLVLVALPVVLTCVALLALRTPKARGLVQSQANDALSGLFRGRIVVEGIGEVGLGGVSDVEARVLDAQGREVIHANGLSARLSVLGLAWQLLGGNQRQLVLISDVKIDDATVTFYDEPDAGVSIASAFALATPSDTATDSESTVDVALPNVQITRAHARGAIAGQVMDADGEQLAASFEYALGVVRLDVQRANIVARQLPAAVETAAHVHGSLEVPVAETEPLRASAALSGTLAGAPFDAQFDAVGEHLSAWLHASQIAPEAINQRIRGLEVTSPTAVYVEAEGTPSALLVKLNCDSEALVVDARGEVTFEPTLSADVEATLSEVDVSKLVSAPSSDVEAVLRVQAYRSDDGPLVLVHRMRALPSLFAGQPTPDLVVEGYVELGAGVTSLGGDLRVAETGALVTGEYWADFVARGVSEAAGVVDARFVNPPRLRSVSGIEVEGEARVAASWRSDESILADLDAALERVSYQRRTIRDLRVKARLNGTTSKPHALATLALDLAGGHVDAEVDADASTQTLELRATRLAATELAELAELPDAVQRGTIDVTIAARRAGHELTGDVDIAARNLDVAGLRDAHIDAQLAMGRNGKATAYAAARLGRLGSVSVRANDVVVPRTPTSLRVETLQGSVSAEGDLSLAQLSTLMATTELPVEKLEGRVAFDVSAARERGQRPTVQVRVHSERLGFVGKRDSHGEFTGTTSAIEQAPRVMRGLDVNAGLDLRPDADEVEIEVHVSNQRTPMAVLSAKSSAAAVWKALQQPERLSTLPVTASIEAPLQPLQRLPPAIRPGTLTGSASLDARMQGSIAAPKVEVAVETKSLQTEAEAPALDVNLTGEYTKGGGKVVVVANGDRTRADATVAWDGDLARISEMTERDSPLHGEIAAHWTGFPCAMIPQLSERQVSGNLDGELKLTNWGEDPRLETTIRSTSLKVDKLPVRTLEIESTIDGKRLKTDVLVELSRSSMKASLDSRVNWGKRSVPVLERDARARVEAQRFQLATLSPLIARQVSELSGLLDAQAELTITPNGTELRGKAQVNEGILQVPALGQRLSNIAARIEVADNRVKVEELSASGLTGRVRATAFAELDGFSVSRAEADLQIASNEKIPVTLEGVALGDASGRVHAVYVDRPERPELTVDVPLFVLTTPETGGYGLQELDRPSEIRVGVRRADGQFVSLPVQPLEPDSDDEVSKSSGPPLRIQVRLGDVTVERGRTAAARLGGELQVVADKQTHVTGRIEISGGELDVQGKRFEIERGVVVFDGSDSSNPTITATARWDSPTDHAVYAEYVGDVETGKIKLHSEPPLTQDEIASLLLFGTLDGTMGTAEGSEATMAVSVAGGTVAQGLNRALSAFTNLDLSARVDTSTGTPRPELVFQVTPRVSAKVSRAVGEPSAGEAPDRTFLTLELRLRRAWALSAVFGDRGGSALDLIWRRRY